VVGDILQPSHLLFILVIALIVLGPKRLPDVGRSLGKGLRDFRNALSGADPRDDLAQLNQQAMAPIHATPPAEREEEAVTAVASSQEPEPVTAVAPAHQAPPEQHESD
jgi:sec-independent protein translocase protein TatA